MQEMSPDTLTSGADFISTVYFVTTDTNPGKQVNGQAMVELRQYSTIIYHKNPTSDRGDFYSLYFSERGLPEELQSKQEIRYKMQKLLTSCKFGDFK